MRPLYLPREFSNIVFNVVYIPPNANDSDVTEQLVSIVQEQEDRWPDAAVYVLGDFNHVTLRDHLPHFSQHVTVPTRKEKTIDLCYSNTPDFYKSYQLLCLGDSDHNMVHIIMSKIQKWNADTEDTLKACFECTDWDVFKTQCENLNEPVMTVNSYINFCV
ncbi:ReO_6 protein [Elysia marginata]|uniref:ReO_6 protein n=1 Tax=Elysia marginata TaxID=1093978 RepID=A0AAV4JHI5_9GAST|nr:ReO_6 protein [Elysia marginata]